VFTRRFESGELALGGGGRGCINELFCGFQAELVKECEVGGRENLSSAVCFCVIGIKDTGEI
jgi:hypothetical protein